MGWEIVFLVSSSLLIQEIFIFFNDSINNYYGEIDTSRKYKVYEKCIVVTLACRLCPFQEDEIKSRDSDFYP